MKRETSSFPARIAILGVPRSGKSTLARRVCASLGLSHLPVDSLVSALGEALPVSGIGRQHPDAAIAAAMGDLLTRWSSHLDYENIGYVLEGYHIDLETGTALAARGLRVVALGYAAAEVGGMCDRIEADARPGDWAADLSRTRLEELVARYIGESAVLQQECEAAGLRYFEVGEDRESALARAQEFLAGASGLHHAHLRIARPSDDLDAVVRFYRDGLGFSELGGFRDHDGFDGVMLGHADAPYHLEFTRKSGHAAGRAPTQDNLLVFYLPDAEAWTAAVARLVTLGHKPTPAFNPYWDRRGRTFEDPDGYRVVLQNAAWPTTPRQGDVP